MFTASITLVYIRSKSNTECKHVYFSKLNKKCRDYLLIQIHDDEKSDKIGEEKHKEQTGK
jgi:hypothetical protein